MKFVKYTSIGLIIGFGGYACYRLIVKQRPNKNVKLVPKTKPPPFSSEPVAEKDLQTNTMNSSSTLLLKQDKKTDMSSSDKSKEIFQPLDSEQLPPKEEFQRQLGENSKPDEDTKHDEDSKPNEDIKPGEDSKLGEDSKPNEDSKLGEDSKPNEDSEPNEDIKPDEDTKPGEDTKPDEDSKLDQPSKPSEDSKPNQDTKPGEDTKPDQDSKLDQDSKAEKESKADEDSYPNENFKPDELDTNQANGKIENKTIDETNEETEPQVVLSPASDKSYQINQDATINSTSDLDASISIDNKKNSIKETSMLSNDSPSTTNCSLDVCPSTPCSSPLDVSELEGETTTGSVDNYLTQRSFSMTSQSSVIGEGMVAKLEQLLHQAGNLAESVGEMNADVATLRRIEPKLLSIAGDSISLGEETNCDSMIINGKDETSQTPSLEWDSNGINLVSEPDSNYSTIKEEDESLLNESLLGDISLSDKSGLLSPISSASLNSSIEPSFLKSTLGDITGQSDSLEHNEKEIISLNFSTSDANENFNESKSIAQSNGSLSVDK